MIKSYIQRAKQLPFHVVIKKALSLFLRYFIRQILFYRQAFFSTYKSHPHAGLNYIFQHQDEFPSFSKKGLLEGAENVLNHKFNLLGSGITPVFYGMPIKGFNNIKYNMIPDIHPDSDGSWLARIISKNNLKHSQYIWKQIGPDYQPICWHSDFKSGYMWNSQTHIYKLSYGGSKGVDVKVPWELSRLQHLLPLACLYAVNPKENKKYADEVICQILDFVCQNPPQYGVNWLCPMDVGIRISNMILAINILNSQNYQLNDDFKKIFIDTIIHHAENIILHLEWSNEARSNHYIADVLGLLFCSIALKNHSQSDQWLYFAIQEINKETLFQFYADGSNYEGSTYYHRLSTEMLIFGFAMIMGQNKEIEKRIKSAKKIFYLLDPSFGRRPNFYPDYKNDIITSAAYQRLFFAVEFLKQISMPNGQAPQIGDNDSGRFVKIDNYCVLNIDNTISSGQVLFDDIKPRSYESYLIYLLLNHNQKKFPVSQHEITVPVFKSKATFADLKESFYQVSPLNRQSYHIQLDNFIHDDLQLIWKNDFGLAIWKNEQTFISLRFKNHYGQSEFGHTHDDNLSLEVYHIDQHLIADKGSAIYTPDIDKRNTYRSAIAHFTPRPSNALPAIKITGNFSVQHLSTIDILHLSKAGAAVSMKANDWCVTRYIEIKEDGLYIDDSCDNFLLEHLFANYHNIEKSYGYGCYNVRKKS